MKLEDIHQTSVLGAGIMGHGIAQCFLMAGYPVMLYDVDQSILDRARSHIEQGLERFSQFGLINKADVASSLQRLTATMELKRSVEESQFIVEAAPENLALKEKLFADVEAHCTGDAILASNTSSLTLADMGGRVKRKERLVITHWFNPPHIVPTVEVVKSQWTSEQTMDTTIALLTKLRKLPVRINRELPGFIVNRIQMALIREVLSLYEQEVASAEDIDRAVRGSIGFRLASIGPLQTVDFGGIGLWLKVCQNLMPAINSSTAAPRVLEDLVSQGCDGLKSGKGFYDYSAAYESGKLDEAVEQRDREFLNRLKNLYWKTGHAPEGMVKRTDPYATTVTPNGAGLIRAGPR
ncbi:MAG: 3-hydroxyacyl-CoA dehydrogenase family protein [Deltaproteobacteria bacterium]